MTIDIDLKNIMRLCEPIAQQAGEMIKASWNKSHLIEHKGAIDLVTETDKAVEAYLSKELCQILPEAAFLGEESGQDIAEALASHYCWVVDPVDGTTNFVHRLPMAAASIALCRDGAPVLGLIAAPMLNETYTAIKGFGAFLNGAAISVSKAARLCDCLVATGFPYEIKPQLDAIIARLRAVLPATQGLRRPGAASLDLAWVASGRLDIFYEDGLKPWDMAAGWLLVTEAGGQISQFDGSPFAWSKSLLATNGLVHQEMTALLSRA